MRGSQIHADAHPLHRVGRNYYLMAVVVIEEAC